MLSRALLSRIPGAHLTSNVPVSSEIWDHRFFIATKQYALSGIFVIFKSVSDFCFLVPAIISGHRNHSRLHLYAGTSFLTTATIWIDQSQQKINQVEELCFLVADRCLAHWPTTASGCAVSWRSCNSRGTRRARLPGGPLVPSL